MNIYLKKEYSYRRWESLLGGILGTLIGAVPLFCFVIPGLFTNGSQSAFNVLMIPFLLFALGIPALLIYAGLWVLHAWFTQKINILEVSEDGVRYGSRFRRWEEIKWFSWHQAGRGNPTLFYQKTGFSFDYNLPVTDPLSEDEIMNLFDILEREVCPAYKNLNIG
jgi:hypothetical protein